MIPKAKFSSLAIVLVAVLALALGVYKQQQKNQPLELEKAIILPQTKPLNEYQFTDHRGIKFSSEHMRGYWNIVFFGFTNCPDICPTTLQTLKQVKQLMSEAQQWGKYRVLMVTVDPKRDTLEKLANYLPFFDPEFIGLRGSLDGTTRFAKQLGILFIARDEQDKHNYQVDHSSAIILINPKGEMAGVLPTPHRVEDIRTDLVALAGLYANDHLKETSDKTIDKVLKAVPTENQNGHKLETDLSIENAWIRPMPASAERMAAYFTLHNRSNRDITIVDSSSPQFNQTMIHDTVLDNGIARMQHLAALTIRAGQTINLQPLAKHMMLVNPVRALNIGESATINLLSDKGRTFSISVSVREQPQENKQPEE